MKSENNMSPNFEDASEFVRGAYGPHADFNSPEKTLTPAAWHRSRKQWVREEQWLSSISNLIDADHTAEKGVLQYMTLPGQDMLDVRMVGALCKQKKYRLKMLGFDETSTNNLLTDDGASAALGPLAINGLVTRDSHIYPDKFQSLANPKSMGSQKLLQVGTQDVINLDFCNSLAAYQQQPNDPTNYNAIHQLFEFQRCNRTKPFLVFLTTRADAKAVDSEAFGKLNALLVKNCGNVQFDNAMRIAFEIGKHQVISYKEQGKKPPTAKYSRIFLVGLSKWLIGLLLKGSPKWKIELVNACEYSVYANQGREMLSLCYRCEMIKVPSADGARLSNRASATSTEPSEVELAINVVQKAAQMFDLDEYIFKSDLYPQLAGRAADVMEQAGYKKDEYLDWCFNQKEHPLLTIPPRNQGASAAAGVAVTTVSEAN